MTYADMITLLLCLFVLLASTSILQKKNMQKDQAVQKVEKEQTPVPSEQPVTEKTSEQVPSRDSLLEIIDNLKSQIAENFKQNNGDRLTSFEISSTAFFNSGSATLNPSGKVILHNVAGNLKGEKFQDYEVTVEGHTDDAPISTSSFPSNWELSTARAAAVVRFFLEEGIPAQRLRAAGYADTFPKLSNRDANGNAIPENQAKNRRVIIKLEKVEKQPDTETYRNKASALDFSRFYDQWK